MHLNNAFDSCQKQNYGQCMLWDEHIIKETECKTTYGWEIILADTRCLEMFQTPCYGRRWISWGRNHAADCCVFAQQEFTGAMFLFTFAVFLQTPVDLWWKQFQFCHLENSGEDRKREMYNPLKTWGSDKHKSQWSRMCQRVQSEWTHLQQLMVATLLDDAPRVVAAHAEPGSGRSVAATLATVEVYFNILQTPTCFCKMI